MSDNPEIKVVVVGDASNAVEELKNVQKEATDTAKKVRDSGKGLSGMAEQFTKGFSSAAFGFGGMATLGVKAADAVLEGLKGLAEIIPNAIETTNKLGESYRQLAITAGMGSDEFNAFNVAIKLSGGNIEDLSAIVQGMERGIKTNTEVLVANGIAADRVSLSHMTLAQYVSKVVETMESLTSATDKDQLLMAAFGRGGMQFAAALEEINKHMKEGEELANRHGLSMDSARKMMEESHRAAGRLKLAEEELAQVIAENNAPMMNAWTNMKSAMVESRVESEMALNAMHRGLIQVQLDTVTGTINMRALREEYEKMLKDAELGRQDMPRELMHAQNAGKSKSFVSPQDLAEKAKSQKEAQQSAKQAAETMKSIDGQRLQIDAEDLKTLENATLEEKKRQDIMGAGARLQAQVRQINETLDKSNTPANREAAEKARLSAFKAYDDRLLQIDRENGAQRSALHVKLQDDLRIKESEGFQHRLAEIQKWADGWIRQNATLGANAISAEDLAYAKAGKILQAYRDQVKADLKDLKAELSDLSNANGGLSQFQTNEVLNRYRSEGGSSAQAANQYSEQMHMGEGPMAGVHGGMNTFLSQQENQWKTWEGFTVGVLDSVGHSVAGFFESLFQHGMTGTERLKMLFEGLSSDAIHALAQMGAKELEYAAIKALATKSGAADQIAANATKTSSNLVAASASEQLAASEIWSAYAWMPFVGEALAVAEIAAMEGSMVAVMAREKGGPVSSMTPYLVGERGPELFVPGASGSIVPNHELVSGAASNFAGNLASHRAQMSSLQSQSASYGSGGMSASGGVMPGHGQVFPNALIVTDSLEAQRVFDDHVRSSNARIGHGNG